MRSTLSWRSRRFGTPSPNPLSASGRGWGVGFCRRGVLHESAVAGVPSSGNTSTLPDRTDRDRARRWCASIKSASAAPTSAATSARCRSSAIRGSPATNSASRCWTSAPTSAMSSPATAVPSSRTSTVRSVTPAVRGHTNCCEKHQTLGVHCDGGLRPRFLVPARKLHVSRKLSFEQLALVETLAIGCHAIDRAAPRSEDSCLIIGAGPIGLATLEFVKLTGAKSSCSTSTSSGSTSAGGVMGVAHTVQSSDKVEQDLRELTDGHLPDVVIDATGNSGSMSSGVRPDRPRRPPGVRRHHDGRGAFPPCGFPSTRGHAAVFAERSVGGFHADHPSDRGGPSRHRPVDHASLGL